METFDRTTALEHMNLISLGDQISNSAMFLGALQSHDDFSKFLLEKSGKCYAKGEDKEALLLRNLAKECVGRAESKRREYGLYFEEPRKNAFIELRKRDRHDNEKAIVDEFVDFLRIELDNQDGMPHSDLDLKPLVERYFTDYK